MRAARIHRFGGPEVLRFDEVKIPKPKRDELLVRVHATSLNHIDVGMRRGDLKVFAVGRLPLTLGFDLAGEVVACGAQVTAFAPGDRVFGAIGHRGGAAADYACVKQSKVARVPPTVALTTLAAVPIAGLTALQALRVYARLRPGQRVLVNGASGGVGAFGVSLAKLFGAQVTGICSEAKRDFVRGLGADEVLDYRTADFTNSNRCWDIVFDAAGNRTFGEVRRVLSPRGVMVTTRLAPRVALSMLTPARRGARRLAFVPARERSMDLAFLASLVEQGELHVPVARTFRFEEMAAAHHHLESGNARGKIVVRLR